MRAIVALVLLLTPSPALACWDGTRAEVGRVVLMDGELEWSAERASRLATWLARIDALLPEGASVTVEFGYVGIELADGNGIETEWDGLSLAGLFRTVATSLAVPAERVRAARSLVVPVFTVQAGAFSSPEDGARFAASLDALGEHGFFETGGFPAENPTAHVLEAAGPYRVVVGAFADRASAQALADRLGGSAFVRVL